MDLLKFMKQIENVSLAIFEASFRGSILVRLTILHVVENSKDDSEYYQKANFDYEYKRVEVQ